jgi:two-component system, NarL family, sensor kinase
VRSVSYLLHPPLLDVAGLRSALKEYVDGFAVRSGILTLIDVQPPEFPRLAPDLETTVYRIVQEALTNVFRHSGARNAGVSLLLLKDQVSLKIRDDGNGLPQFASKSDVASIGVGLEGMRQRAKDSEEICSSPMPTRGRSCRLSFPPIPLRSDRRLQTSRMPLSR